MTRQSLLRACLALVLSLGVGLLAPIAHAETPVTLYKSFAGNLNFTGTEFTLRNSPGNVCSVHKSSHNLSKKLNGLPPGATVLAAYLYWAGSGSTPDYDVTFQGSAVTAQRKYTGSYKNGSFTNYYFAGVTDVTSTVKAKGNATYTVSGLSVDTSWQYCDVEGVVGGFALLVIYSDPKQPFRVLNMYEGFQSTRYSSIALNVSNFKMPSPLDASMTGRIGHITWEGDQSLNQDGENLSFNNTILTDALNPPGNQFDSKSNIDGDKASYGIDFDAYTIASPVIKAGDTAATTTYASGQDLVWLNVEIVAVPNIPAADLAITMTRTGNPSPGATVSYALSVTNIGPNDDPGPLTVTNKLPPGMTYSSVSGTNWTCTFSGADATCKYSLPVLKGQTLPTITVRTVVDGSSTYTSFTNTATVGGSPLVFDNVTGNNTASDTSIADKGAGTGYVFTVGECKAGKAIGSVESECTRLSTYVAGSLQPLYITYQVNNIATWPGKTSANVILSLTCVNPVADAGKVAMFQDAQRQNSLPLKPCYQDGDVPPGTSTTYWTAKQQISFPIGSPSGRPSNGAQVFSYPDVGQIQLNLVDVTTSTTVTGVTRFISVPTVKFVSIQNSDNGDNPGDGLQPFAKAGEPFKVGIRLTIADGVTFPPNFGKEAGPYGPVGVILGVPDPAKITQALSVTAPGEYSGNLTYSDLGVVPMTATISGQPGQTGMPAGSYFGATVPNVTSDTRTVGYFYPAYFETTTDAPMACLPRMKCPAGVNEAVYSTQPFNATVQAFNMAGTEVTDQLGNIPAFDITLSAVSQPGPGGTPVAAAISGNTISVSPASPTASAKPTITLPTMFSAAAPRGVAWTAPTPAYIRATAPFSRVGTSGAVVSSDRGAGGGSNERGVQVINGRLLVANANGSELLRLPLHLYSQFWTGAAWENNANDSDSDVSYTADYSACRKNLVMPGTTETCKPKVAVLPGPTATFKMNSGQGTVWMEAPGAGNNGSARVRMNGNSAWLPSTIGQVVFGVYKSPLIYVREVY